MPLLFQGIASLVVFSWKRSITRALERADRAEAIARLEHDLAGQGRILAEQKQQLEEGIQQIIDIQMRVAQGDLKSVPLDDAHVLWQLAGLLNTLLARYQQARHAEEELQRTRLAVEYLLRGIRDAKHYHHALVYDKTGTMLDAVVTELQRPVSVENASCTTRARVKEVKHNETYHFSTLPSVMKRSSTKSFMLRVSLHRRLKPLSQASSWNRKSLTVYWQHSMLSQEQRTGKRIFGTCAF